MTILDLCFNRRVIWRGLPAVIVDLRYGVHPRALIRIAGGWQHWVAPAELQELAQAMNEER